MEKKNRVLFILGGIAGLIGFYVGLLLFLR